MKSVYYILYKPPSVDQYDMEIEYETLVQELLKSGKVRIDTDDCCNFARFSDPSLALSLMVSKEELTEPHLKEQTDTLFRSMYKNNLSDEKLNKIYTDLLGQIKKLQPVKHDVAEKLVRILVQAAHPIVTRWILHDKVQVFITYSHNIGDMMSMSDWQKSGSNSGMQSTDGKNACIFVSCGGNPLADNDKENPTYGDGWAAAARMQIVGGQEMGHFADIKRDIYGHQITRHSANFSGTKATEVARIGRLNDLKICHDLFNYMKSLGLIRLLELERELKFYEKNKISNLKVRFKRTLQLIYRFRFLKKTHKAKLFFVKKFKRDKYLASMIQIMIEDMKFNLAPVADVYKSDNPEVEEAIACIEALARVPQQVMKWGYLTTSIIMSNLFKLYYHEVIPSLIENYEALTKQKYTRNFDKPKTFKGFLKKLNLIKSTFVEVRETK